MAWQINVSVDLLDHHTREALGTYRLRCIARVVCVKWQFDMTREAGEVVYRVVEIEVLECFVVQNHERSRLSPVSIYTHNLSRPSIHDLHTTSVSGKPTLEHYCGCSKILCIHADHSKVGKIASVSRCLGLARGKQDDL